MTNKIEVLKQLGLDEKEAKVYLSALEYGPVTMISLAKRSGLKRTSIYNFIDEMIKKGFIVVTVSGKRTLYSAVSPTELEKIAEKQMEKIKEVIPELMFMFKKSPQKPKITFYEGVEGIKAVFNDTLNQPEGSQLWGYANIEAAYNTLSPGFYKEYIKKRVAKKIYGKGFVASDQYAEAHIANNRKELRESIFFSKDEFPISVEINLYQNKTAFMSFGDEKLGIIIESQQITETLRSLFDLLWKNMSIKKGSKKK